MLQGNGLVFEDGKLRHTSDLAPENRKSAVSTVLNDKSAMFRICLTKLSNVVCNVEISDDFGLWMTKNGTTTIQIPIPTQQYYDVTLEDPYCSLSMRTFNVGAMIRGHLKDMIEDYVDNNQNRCSCANLNRLMLILFELEITYMPIDDNGDVLRTAAQLILDRHTDLCPLFKIHTMNRSIADLNRQSHEQISFQPALVYNFYVDASGIQMPNNWLADQIMDADEISTIRFPSVKVNNRLTSTGVPSSVPTIATKELMLRLLDVEVLLTSMINPKNPFPPNARQIALQADSLKRSVADGMYTVEDAELIIEAAAELILMDVCDNRFWDPTWKEEDVPHKEDDSHDVAQQQNDLDLIHHNINQMRNDCKQRASGSTNATMIPSAAEVPDFATVPVMNNALSSDSQVEVPTVATNVAREM